MDLVAPFKPVECCDRKALYDVPVRIRVTGAEILLRQTQWKTRLFKSFEAESNSLRFSVVTDKLSFTCLSQAKWINLKVCCPVSKSHGTRLWQGPGKCPRCGAGLERTLIPYRIWD